MTKLLMTLFLPALCALAANAATAPAAEGAKVFLPDIRAVWGKTTESPGYAAASAHDPAFQDRALWPKMCGKESFLAQQWPKARRLVYDIAANVWLEDGKPTSTPPDRDTDIVLPDSPTRYHFKFPTPEEQATQYYRHITVGRNAVFRGGGDGIGRKVLGNVWVKRGGIMRTQGATVLLGGSHTFFRNDNDVAANIGEDNHQMCSQYFRFEKSDASVEYLGHVTVMDEFKICSGSTVIVAEDSILQPGRSATPTIEQGGTLALMDGAYWGKWINEFHRAVDLKLYGTLQGGLPERRLTRGCTVGLSFRNWQKIDFSQWPEEDERTQRKKGIKDIRLICLMAYTGSIVRSYSAQPATSSQACLTITWTGKHDTNALGRYIPSDTPASGKGDGKLADPGFLAVFTAIPRMVTCYFDGTVVDNVRFDHVHPGGLLFKDLAARAQWTNVTFGTNILGRPEDLFKQLAELPRDGNY